MGVKSEGKKEGTKRENNRRIQFREISKFVILCKFKDKWEVEMYHVCYRN